MDNNRANQLNPNNDAFWRSIGHSERPSDWIGMLLDIISLVYSMTKSDNDNRSNQLNPNNDAYYSSRGTSRP